MIHKRGKYSFELPYSPPTNELFEIWLDKWLNLKKTPLDAYLAGAFCQNYYHGESIETGDIDLILTGNNFRYHDLLSDLDNAISEGNKLGIAIDIVWMDRLTTAGHTKILNYNSFEILSDNGNESYIVEGDSKELIPGLFMFTNFDTSKAAEKQHIKNYKSNYIKINYGKYIKR